jgi:hypothetical protein
MAKTPEQRLDQIERILGLFAREGRRMRVKSREQNEKINILIQFQMETTERINRMGAQHDKEMAELRRSQMEFRESQKELRESQKLTDQALQALINSMRNGRNGQSN